MSSEEYEGAPEARSSIKISTTAKGEAVVTVTVREGIGEDELTRLRTLAVDAYRETRKAVA